MDWALIAYAVMALAAAGGAASASDSSRRQANAQKDAQRLLKADQANLPQELQRPFDFAMPRNRFPGPGRMPFPGALGGQGQSPTGQNTLLGQ